MKHLLMIYIALASFLAHAQTDSIELVDEYLSNDTNQSLPHINNEKEQLEKGLPTMMKDHIIRKEQAFRVRTKALKNGIQQQFDKEQPELNLSIRLFEGDGVSNILIHTINQSEGRTFMYGTIKEKPGSKVNLVEYQGSLSGVVRYSGSKKVVLLHSGEGSVSATYEVDTTNVTYD